MREQAHVEAVKGLVSVNGPDVSRLVEAARSEEQARTADEINALREHIRHLQQYVMETIVVLQDRLCDMNSCKKG